MSKTQPFDKLPVLGVNIDAVSNQDAIGFICRRAAPGQPAGYVVKPYVEFLDRTAADASLRELLNGADLVVPDGVALTWATAWLYAGPRSWWRFWLTLFQIPLRPEALRWPLPDRAAGINFTWDLLTTAAQHGLKVYLVGNPRHGSIEHAAATLQAALPKLRLAGARTGRDQTQPSGQVSEGWLSELSQALAQAQPDLILVGTGFPLQEKICAHLAEHLGHGMFIGEGGTFDYERFGGTRPKAPVWLQRSGLEWLWRLGLEPRRLIRQLAIPRFIYRVWRSR